MSILCSQNFIQAQCSLDQVGGVNTVTASALSDMTTANGGTVYTVSYHNTLSKIFLHSAVIAGSYTVVSNIPTTTSAKPIVRINKANGKVYVVIKDDGAGQVGKVYYLSAGSLIQLGPAFSGTNKVSDLSIAFNSLGEEYVAYTDLTNSNKSTVKKWDGVSSWVSVGTGTVSSGAGYYNSLVIDKTDSPVLAYQSIANGSVTAVSKFSGSWNSVGTGTVGTAAANSKLKVASNGDYYLGYTELSGNVVVQKYNGSWAPLGSPVSAMSFTANTFDLDLDPNDMPYFISQNNTSYFAVAYKYNGVPTWANVIGGNLSAVSSGNLNVSIDNIGSPYFFYVDASNGNGLNIKTITSPISLSTQPISVTRCNGQSGSFNVGTVGGVPTSYQWQTLSAGTYTNSSAPYTNATTSTLAFTANSSMNQNQVRCVVNVGCKNIISNTATLTVSSPSIASTSTNPTCFNTNNGAITTTVSGGVTPYSYSWNTGATTSSLTSLFWNTYTLTVLDNASCSSTTVITLTSPPSINTSFSGNMSICNGSSTTLTITANGGIPGYTYSWSPGVGLSSTTSSVVIANPLSSITYTVQVTDANACVATTTVMVNVNTAPTLTVNVTNITLCQGNGQTILASGADTYTWMPGNLTGASQFVTPPVGVTIYTVTGTYTNTGCTANETVTVTVNPLPTANAGTAGTLTCASPTINLSGSTVGGSTYNWTGPGIVSGATTLNPVINSIGTYDLSVTSAQGCSSGQVSVSVTQNTLAPTTTTNVTGVLNCTLTSVNASATTTTSPVTYNWTGSGITSATNISTITVNAGGVKNYTITNTSNGCATTGSLNVSQNLLSATPTATATGTVTCLSNTVQLSGNPASGVSYTWTAPAGSAITSGTNTQNAIGSGAGIYTLSVTMLTSACVNSKTVSVNQNTVAPTLTASASSSVICLGSSTNLSAIGSSDSYIWTPGNLSGATQTALTPTSTTTYTVVGTNTVSGCTNTKTVSVTVNPVPTLTLNYTPTVICNGAQSSLNASGALSFTWSPSGQNGSFITVSPTTTTIYTVTGANASNCTDTKTLSITVNPLPTLTVTAPSSICAGNNATITSAGANSYSLTPGGVYSPSIIVSPSSSTNYTITGTSAAGCASTKTIDIIVNPNPTIAAGPTRSITCANSFTTVTCSSVGGTSYNWTGPGIISGYTTTNCNVGSPGTYTVFAISPFGCNSGNTTVLVVSNTTPPTGVTANTTGSLTCSNLSVALNGTPGTGVTYLWSGPNITGSTTSQNTTADVAGTYTLKVTSTVNSCTNIATTTVGQDITTPTVTASSSGSITCTTNTVQLNGSTGVGITYNWSGPGFSGGTNTQNVIANNSGTYTLTAQSVANGCIVTATTSVTQNTTAPIGVNAGLDKTLSCSSSSVTLNGSVSSPTNAIISWAGLSVCGASNTAITSACAADIYTLTATDPTNGCFSFDLMEVFANVSAPSITASSTATLDCITTSANIIATTTTSPVSYNWTGSGIISGATSSTAIVNQPGTYTIVITNSSNGCSTTSVVSVFQDISAPSITVNASSTSICSGGTTTLTASSSDDPITDYTWSPGPLNGAIQNVSPLANTLYSVVVTNTVNGCTSTETVNITVHTIPTLTISGNTNICKGSSTTLTGNGATSYTWSSGANTTSISVSPTLTTSYSVNGEDANGCVNTATTSVNIVAAKNISGVITNTAGTTSGDLILYKYTPGLSMWDSITTVPLSSNYSFTSIDSSLYVIRAVPTATNIQVTYADSAITWQNATVINHGCTNNTNQNIKLIPLDNIGGGPGILTGFIIQDDGFGERMSNAFKPLVPGNPIGGIVVKGGRNPGGNMFVQTTSDGATGGYTLTNIPLSTGSDHYFIYVDIPGLDTSASYHRVITNTNTIYQNLNWSVDSMYIKPIGEITTIKNNNSLLNNSISVFPNPASSFVNIQYELIQSADIQIMLYDVIGNKIQDIVRTSTLEKNKYNHLIKTEYLSSGIYFIKVKINNSESTIKLIVSN